MGCVIVGGGLRFLRICGGYAIAGFLGFLSPAFLGWGCWTPINNRGRFRVCLTASLVCCQSAIAKVACQGLSLAKVDSLHGAFLFAVLSLAIVLIKVWFVFVYWGAVLVGGSMLLTIFCLWCFVARWLVRSRRQRLLKR